MKTVKQMYMAVTSDGIIFSSDVSYLGNDTYIVAVHDFDDPSSIKMYTAESGFLCKLDTTNLDNLVQYVHGAVYKEEQFSQLDMFFKGNLRSLASMKKVNSESVALPVSFHAGGLVKGGSVATCNTVISCEEDILTAEYVTILRRGKYYYVILACDEKGNPIHGRTRSKASNPYSRNCNIVYDIVAKNPGINTYDIIEKLGWGDTGRVTPRLSELAKGGRVKVLGKEYNPDTKRSISIWGVVKYE